MKIKHSRVPVKHTTYEKLLAKKLEKQHELGKIITWDDFFSICLKGC